MQEAQILYKIHVHNLYIVQDKIISYNILAEIVQVFASNRTQTYTPLSETSSTTNLIIYF